MEYAWVHLHPVGGCHIKTAIRRTANSVIFTDPHQPTQSYRISAKRFDAGDVQFRGSWCVEQWTDKAERTKVAESNWQT